jgi:hypothetical protein
VKSSGPVVRSVVACLVVLLAGCGAVPLDDSPEPAGIVDVYVVADVDALEGAQSYESSRVANVTAVDQAVNAAVAQPLENSSTEGLVLSSAARELSPEEVERARTALEQSGSSPPTDGDYPPGVYFEYGDRYVFVSLGIYD